MPQRSFGKTAAMALLKIVFLGDIFSSRGRMALQQQLPVLREEHNPDLIIANAENARSGSGLSPALYDKIRAMGIDAITLGDHIYREPKIISVLQRRDEPIARPANLPPQAPGRLYTRLRMPELTPRSIFVITLLGQVFFPLAADNPFNTIDRVLAELPEKDPIILVEAHMEATSEKAAMAHHLDGKVAAVLGTHTHVPTADARLLPKGTAFITDVGMCGPHGSVIGRAPGPVIQHMSTGQHVKFDLGTGSEAICGVLLEIDSESTRAKSIQRLQYDADQTQAPFR